MSFKLIYFPARGRAEKIRLLFAEAGKEYKDERIRGEEWQALKPNTPAGMLPVLMYDDVMLYESVAIARFVANQLGLAGSTDVEKAKMDAIVDMTVEIGTAMAKTIFEKDETAKENLTKDFKEKTAPKVLSCFEKLLLNNDFFVGNKVSWADIVTFDTISSVESFGLGEALTAYPKVIAHKKRIGDRPNIKKWIENRPKTQF